jgi:hypothetical protein
MPNTYNPSQAVSGTGSARVRTRSPVPDAGTIGPRKMPQDERTLQPQVHRHLKLKEMGAGVWLGLGLGR